MLTKQNIEYKSLNLAIKSFDSIKGIFKGYASTFNNVDKVYDTMLPESFDNTIKSFNDGSKKIEVNFDHWEKIILSENLTNLYKDEKGLWVEFQVSSESRKTYSKLFGELIILMENDDLFMSIGGYVIKSSLGDDRWVKKEIANANDEISEFDLIHIALTHYPIDDHAKMMEMKSERGVQNKISRNKFIEEIDGEVSAIKFLTTNKSEMSNTCAKNYVLHLKSLWKKELDNNSKTTKSENENLGIESRSPQTASDVGSKNNNDESRYLDIANYLT